MTVTGPLFTWRREGGKGEAALARRRRRGRRLGEALVGRGRHQDADRVRLGGGAPLVLHLDNLLLLFVVVVVVVGKRGLHQALEGFQVGGEVPQVGLGESGWLMMNDDMGEKESR